MDPALLMRGFDSGDEQDFPGVRQLDDETQESEDWAERDLRELRQHVATPTPTSGRRQTINGIDVAPRSELSPPISSEKDGPVMPDDAMSRNSHSIGSLSKGKKGKFGSTRGTASSSSINQISAGDSFFIDGSVPKQRGTLRRLGTKLREKKQTRAGARKSTGEVFDKLAAGAINDSLSSGGGSGGGAGGSSSGSTTPTVPPLSMMGHSSAAELEPRVADELFRFVLERALDSDENIVRTYVFTMSYFTDPVRVLSDLITEHDVAVAALQVAEDGDDASNVARDRAMKIVSFWVSHLWYQFESSEPLMNILMNFVENNRDHRWGERLADTIDTLTEGRKALKKARDAILAHGHGLTSKEDLFGEIDPEDQRLLEEANNSDNVDDVEESPAADGDDDVKSTFVGAETYTDKSRPMGLAALLEELDTELSPIEEPPEGLKPNRGSARAKVLAKLIDNYDDDDNGSTNDSDNDSLVGAEKYNQKSRPMGLFGLLDTSVAAERSMWELGRQGGQAHPESLAFVEDSTRTTRAADIARHLTLIEFVHWKLVSPLELQRAVWKNGSDDKGMYIRQVIGWHNRIASWVQYEILSRGTNVVKRVQAVQRFLTICLHLEVLQNFHTMFGILAGLKVSSVARLRVEFDMNASWASLYRRLMALGSTRNNWEAYRTLKRRATQFPFFPFLGVYLQDFQVLEAKQKTFVGDELKVNVDKMQKLGSLLTEMVYVQRGSEYSFRQIPRVMTYLLSLKHWPEDELWDMSCSIVAPLGENRERAHVETAFIASVISPRPNLSTSQSGILPPGPASVESLQARKRSSSIGDSFRSKWKPRKDSDPQAPARDIRSKSGSSSPRNALSPRSRDGSVSARPGTEVLCPLCSAGCLNKDKLVEHLTHGACTGSSSKPHTCPVCEGSFASKEDLVPHLTKRQCSPRPTAVSSLCPVCETRFSSAADLRAHLHSRSCME